MRQKTFFFLCKALHSREALERFHRYSVLCFLVFFVFTVSGRVCRTLIGALPFFPYSDKEKVTCFSFCSIPLPLLSCWHLLAGGGVPQASKISNRFFSVYQYYPTDIDKLPEEQHYRDTNGDGCFVTMCTCIYSHLFSFNTPSYCTFSYFFFLFLPCSQARYWTRRC